MSVKERRLLKLDQKIVDFTRQKKSAQAWAYRLYYEFVKNDVAIRAESLSYFTLFSLLPLMTGIFLFLSLFSEWAPIQKEFDGLIQNFLQAIPEDQRATLMDFVSQFRDQYLARISSQSSSIGIFAFLVLIWISGKVFFNLESLMNRIWAVKRDRKFLARIQNFILCIVIFPFSYVLALSLPHFIRHSGQRELGHLLHQVIPTLIIFSSLIFIFRFFPNTKVKWRSAAVGASVSTIGFGISNFLLSFYFYFGTSTAYGKAGLLPVLAFFIYVAWLIFILGVEVSLLCQSETDYAIQRLPHTTLAQALILERVVKELSDRFQKNQTPVSVRELANQLRVEFSELETVFAFLREKRRVIVAPKKHFHDEDCHALVEPIDGAHLINLIKEFLDLSSISQNFDVIDLITRLK